MPALKKEELRLDSTVTQNSKGEAILGRLYGTVADVVNPTRNGRKYDDALWEKVFEDPIVNEYFECGGLLGELNHPADREETDLTQVAVCMPEKPKKNKDGKLEAYLDILDTPNGRIVATLAKYGYKLGISSRGTGETYEAIDGEHVDEDTYKLEAWDIVLLPAVKSARLKMVESLQNGKSLKQALCEQLDKATEDERVVMKETLDKLNIDYNKGRYQILVSNRVDLKDEKTKEQSDDLEQLKKIANKYKGKFSNISIFDTESGEDVFELEEEYTPEKVIDKSELAANDNGASMVKDLQESLLAQRKLESQITELQEKLSVCYAKEAKYEEDIGKYKNAIRNLSESVSNAKALQGKVEKLTEELNQKDLMIKQEQDKYQKLIEKRRIDINRQSSLNESISSQANKLKEKETIIRDLNEEFKSFKQESIERENSLNESLEEIKKNLTIKTNEYNSKLANANKLIEQYRKTAKTAVNKYIESQALRLGVSANEIKNKLSENYSFSDIDEICESLSNFNLTVSGLPLNLQKGRVKIQEGKEPILKSNPNDIVDDSLLRLANLK